MELGPTEALGSTAGAVLGSFLGRRCMVLFFLGGFGGGDFGEGDGSEGSEF